MVDKLKKEITSQIHKIFNKKQNIYKSCRKVDKCTKILKMMKKDIFLVKNMMMQKIIITEKKKKKLKDVLKITIAASQLKKVKVAYMTTSKFPLIYQIKE